MKIVLATCGSRSDVQPMIALCLALKTTGHDTILIGLPKKALWAQQMGCTYKAFGRDLTDFINQMDNTVSLSTGLSFISFVKQEIKTQFEVLPRLVARTDLIIGSSLVFGLSSIAQKLNIPLLIDSARQLGQRMIIAKFWDSSVTDPKGDDIFFLKTYPHLHLFPKMAAVIHHGGAGTTACAALSGVPQVIVPHILDQFFHKQKIYSTGLGPKPIWRSKFTRIIPYKKQYRQLNNPYSFIKKHYKSGN